MGSAAVDIREIDLTTRVPQYPGTYGGMVIRANRGKLDEAVLITNETDFLKKFTGGERVEVGMASEYYSALTFLQKSDKLWVVRAYHHCTDTDEFETWNDATAYTGTDYVVPTVPVPGLGYHCTTPGTSGAVEPTWPTTVGATVKDPVDRTGAITKLEDGTGGKILVTSAAHGLSDGDSIVISGTTSYNGPFTVSDKAADTFKITDTYVADETSGTWTYATPTAVVWTCVTKEIPPLYGAMFINESTATSYDAPLADDSILEDPDTYSSFTSDQSVLIYAADPGAWSDNIFIQVITDAATVKEDDAFIVNVYKKLTTTSYVLLETWTCSLYENHLDGYGRNIYAETLLEASAYIRAYIKKPISPYTVKATPAATETWEATTAYTTSPLSVINPTSSSNTSITFVCTTAGTSGATEPSWNYTINATTSDGSAVWTAKYALVPLNAGQDGDSPTTADMMLAADLLNNTDSIPLTMLMDGGYTTPAYQLYLDGIAAARKDSIALLSLPYAQEAAAKVSGIQTLVTYKTSNLTALATSSYSAILAGWVKIYDKFNDREIWIDPTGFWGAVISYTGSNYELWYPPAGWRRGPIRVLDVLQHLNKSERDLLYDANINPIKWGTSRGISIFGQKTTLTRPSALDRMNVRLLLCVIEPLIAYALEDFLFEINDEATRSLVRGVINSYMRGIKARRGVYDYKVKCDSENNTSEDIDNHKLNVWLLIKPIKSIEYIQFDVVLTRTGMDFSLAAQSLMVK